MKLSEATGIPAVESELKVRLEKLGHEWARVGRNALELSDNVESTLMTCARSETRSIK